MFGLVNNIPIKWLRLVVVLRLEAIVDLCMLLMVLESFLLTTEGTGGIRKVRSPMHLRLLRVISSISWLPFDNVVMVLGTTWVRELIFIERFVYPDPALWRVASSNREDV